MTNQDLDHSIIDISHHQFKNDATVKFDKLDNDGVKAVIHKVTQNTTFVDPKYHDNVKLVNETAPELLWGTYHFATGADAKAQVEYFLNNVIFYKPNDTDNAKGYKQSSDGKYPLLALDLEENTVKEQTTVTREVAEEMVELLFQATGTYPIIYTNTNFINKLLDNGKFDSILYRCPLWLARYTDLANKVTIPTLPQVIEGSKYWGSDEILWNEWTIWQYTDGVNGADPKELTAVVDNNGKSMPCDRNRYNNSRMSLSEFWQTYTPKKITI